MPEEKTFQVRLIPHAGEVLVSLSVPCNLITFGPALAREFAAQLITMAVAAERQLAEKSAGTSIATGIAEAEQATVKH